MTNHRRTTCLLAVSSLVLIAACGENSVSKATPERLAALVENGIDSEEKARIEERVANAKERNKSAPGVLAAYDDEGAILGAGTPAATLLSSALERNSDIARAAQQINRADAERLNAIFGYLPQVSASVTVAQNNQNVKDSDNAVFQLGKAEYQSTDISVELSQPIFDLSRIYAIKLSKTARAASEVAYVSTVQEVMYQTFDAYVAASQSKNRVQSLQRQQSFLTRQLSAESARQDLGLSEEAAKNALQIEVADLGLDIAQETLTYNTALSNLSALVGRSVQDIATASVPRGVFGAERRVSVAAAVNQAAEQNPRLLLSLVRVAESDIRKRQALAADFSPVMTAFARYVHEDREASRFGGGSVTADQVIGLRLVVPIFNARGEGMTSIVSRVDFRDALNQYMAEKRAISADIRATHARLEAVTQSLSRARAASSNSSKLVAAEQARVDLGQSQDYVVATLQVQAANASERVRFYELEYLRAWARLEYLSGLNLAKRI